MMTITTSKSSIVGKSSARKSGKKKRKPKNEIPNPAPHWKRLLDLGCIFVSLPLLLPVTLFISILIKLVSSGPVLYRQKRIGFRGKPFTIFKFRTMIHGAGTNVHQEHCKNLMKSNAPMKKIDAKDKRLIPFGLILRSSGLDELPQLLNVIRGDMSLVGPRPCVPYEHEHYLPSQKERANALPGLTGLWQVSGKNRTTFQQMIKLDIQYVRTKSLSMDLYILLMTFPSLVVQIYDTWREKRGQKATTSAARAEFKEETATAGFSSQPEFVSSH